MNKNIHDFIESYLSEHKEYFFEMSKFIYEHPETRFEEHQSYEFYVKESKKQGFEVRKNIANIPTAFTATYGSGKPVIAFLGEYDALPGLSQEPLETEKSPLKNHVGHGCGHNLLGVGAFAAACAVKTYLKENNLPGTVVFYGCPGEEGGSGKTFMARDGAFEGIDSALTWHPSPSNSIMNISTLANYQIEFKFKGIAAHAANSPHLGRSALDAVELMNVGVNYLREHIIQDARVHYAVTNTGGLSPNVVQSDASVMYLIRAPQIKQVEEIYQRICKIAEGSSLMTETEVTVNFNKGCSNYIPNQRLEEILYDSFLKVGSDVPTQEEYNYAKNIWNTFSDPEQNFYVELMEGFGYQGNGSEFAGKYLSDSISPYKNTGNFLYGSTDVADVSWVVPTAQLSAATSALGTALHTWQMTSQGLSTFAHKGMLRAAKTMALTGGALFTSEQLLKEVKDEFSDFQKENPYKSPIPNHVKPTTLQGRAVY